MLSRVGALTGVFFGSSSSSSDSSEEVSSSVLDSDSSFFSVVCWCWGKNRLWKGFFSVAGGVDGVLSTDVRVRTAGFVSFAMDDLAGVDEATAAEELELSVDAVDSLLWERVVFFGLLATPAGVDLVTDCW